MRRTIKAGVPMMGLMQNGVQVKRQVNTLMIETWDWMINDQEWPDHFDTPVHLDGDRENCAIQNLMLRPRWFAIMFHKECRMRPFPNWRQPLEIVQTGEVFHTVEDCSQTHGVLQKEIHLNINTDRTVFPYYWNFIFRY